MLIGMFIYIVLDYFKKELVYRRDKKAVVDGLAAIEAERKAYHWKSMKGNITKREEIRKNRKEIYAHKPKEIIKFSDIKKDTKIG